MVVVTGTRVQNRSALDTAVAVDVLPVEDLQKGGLGEVNQALSVNLPSFNFPRPALNDGTDTIRPATLRGLAPDQTLVLVNSKRRHASSLVNVNGSIGRGSSAVDMNTIPNGAISAIEVLRDGASAQYGSDAIAGVINMRLREASSGGNVSASYGYRDTSYTVPTNAAARRTSDHRARRNHARPRRRRDGRDLRMGRPAAVRRERLPHADGRIQAAEPHRASRSRHASAISVGRHGLRFARGDLQPLQRMDGEPEIDQLTLFANAGYDIGDDAELYGWASYQDREAISAGFYRRALDDRNIISIYPDGFLPQDQPGRDRPRLGRRYALPARRVGHGHFAGLRIEPDGVHHPRHAQPLDRADIEDRVRRWRLRILRRWCSTSPACTSTRSASPRPSTSQPGSNGARSGYEIFAGEPDSFRNGGRCSLSTPAAARWRPLARRPGLRPCLLAAPNSSGAQVFPGFRPPTRSTSIAPPWASISISRPTSPMRC